MNGKLAVLALVAVTGCSIVGPVYDTNEYAAFVQVAHLSDVGSSSCATASGARDVAKSIFDSAKYAEIYSRHQPYDNNVNTMAQIIVKMSNEFLVRASSTNMSEQYCKFKLQAIERMSENVMQAVSEKRR